MKNYISFWQTTLGRSHQQDKIKDKRKSIDKMSIIVKINFKVDITNIKIDLYFKFLIEYC